MFLAPCLFRKRSMTLILRGVSRVVVQEVRPVGSCVLSPWDDQGGHGKMDLKPKQEEKHLYCNWHHIVF